MSSVTLHDKEFDLLIPKKEIKQSIKAMAEQINQDYLGKEVCVVGVLDGAFMVLSSLLKRLNLNISLELVKLKSYEGQSSSGEVKKLLGLTTSLQGKHVLVVEDIVDTGHTLQYIMDLIESHSPASVEIATLLIKPDVFQDKFPVRYQGLAIPNKFVVGFGMDYDGQGRQLPDIYAATD
ncbi:hypoxanthine phosphoribosyltransferase [Marinoscillum sp.]|uniref:hypoxanthine phosphoribosyltransferase n=1 Tax=Marinoscillum sp. TaxID=2024838 RepID=UPI003BA88CC5